jgi:flagellum-specific ATP synthase
MKFRRLYTLLKENETLIRIGAYTKGTDAELDEAINKKDIMQKFISQSSTHQEKFEESSRALIQMMGAN